MVTEFKASMPKSMFAQNLLMSIYELTIGVRVSVLGLSTH